MSKRRTEKGKELVRAYAPRLAYHMKQRAKKWNVRIDPPALDVIVRLLSRDETDILASLTPDFRAEVLRVQALMRGKGPPTAQTARVRGSARGTKQAARVEAERCFEHGLRLLRELGTEAKFDGKRVEAKHVYAYAACAGGLAAWPYKR